MTLEEMVTAIQQGRTDLYMELWEQTRRFIAKKALNRYFIVEWKEHSGLELDDLIQSGFLALHAAVQDYDPAKGRFLGLLSLHLKSTFAEACGIRTTKRDPLNNSISLDTPLDDSADSDTLLDLQADPANTFEEVDRRIWLEQLHAALDLAMSSALSERERSTLQRRYWQNQTLKKLGEADSVSIEAARRAEWQAIQKLRRTRSRFGLDQFMEDQTPYFARISPAVFNTTHTSAVEVAVLKRDRLEKLFNQCDQETANRA